MPENIIRCNIKKDQPELTCDNAQCICHVVSAEESNHEGLVGAVRKLIHSDSEIRDFLTLEVESRNFERAGHRGRPDFNKVWVESVVVRTTTSFDIVYSEKARTTSEDTLALYSCSHEVRLTIDSIYNPTIVSMEKELVCEDWENYRVV